MKRVTIFMALALFALFGLFAFNHYLYKPLPEKKEKKPLAMTVIPSEVNASLVNNVAVPVKNHLSDQPEAKFTKTKPASPVKKKVAKKATVLPKADVKPIPDYLDKSIKWLSDAQFENGGWGAGMASQQNIRDPKLVKIDPATTAFSAMALMNTGSSIDEGIYSKNIKKALELLLEMVENSPQESKNITNITGTQPQNKLGQNIDLSMTAQFLARALTQIDTEDPLRDRTNTALEKCVAKIESSQHKDGSWNDQGWAPVLQSAMANNALEMSSQIDGIKVSEETMTRSQQYQESNISASGDIATEKAAGVQLYAYSSTQRATAVDARRVTETLEDKDDFAEIEEAVVKMPAPAVIEEVVVLLEDEGIQKEEAKEIATAYVKNRVASTQLNSEAVLSGFGNNGGEEYLSYMMTSESMVESGDQAWDEWHQKMKSRLGKVQNGDGSWSGHHCITSPVFCTAAVIMTLTADRK